MKVIGQSQHCCGKTLVPRCPTTGPPKLCTTYNVARTCACCVEQQNNIRPGNPTARSCPPWSSPPRVKRHVLYVLRRQSSCQFYGSPLELPPTAAMASQTVFHPDRIPALAEDTWIGSQASYVPSTVEDPSPFRALKLAEAPF